MEERLKNTSTVMSLDIVEDGIIIEIDREWRKIKKKLSFGTGYEEEL